ENWIKFFGGDGFKLTDQTEQEIELHIDEDAVGGGQRIGRIREMPDTAEDYLSELERRFGGLSLDGLDVVLDCANGATFRVAPEIFTRLGARVSTLGVTPDGRNINAGCGSTNLGALAAEVRGGSHDLGFAFDGDGDRLLAVDRDGVLVDGDELLSLAAIHLRDLGRLRGNGVAVTVMTNFGFHSAMAQAGIEVTTTAVGDRYVLAALRGRGWTVGGARRARSRVGAPERHRTAGAGDGRGAQRRGDRRRLRAARCGRGGPTGVVSGNVRNRRIRR